MTLGDFRSCDYGLTRDTEILELFRRDGVDFDLLWVPSANNFSTSKAPSSLWATLYGEKGLAADLGQMLQDLGIYLQE